MIITITGDNHHAARAEFNSVIDNFIVSHGDLAVERFDAGEIEAELILSAVSATSLLSPKKMVVIQDFETNKALVERTEDLLAQTPEDNTTLILISKLDKRTAWAKLLKKATDYREFASLPPYELANWVVEIAKQKGVSIDKGTAQYLIDYIGGEQERLSNELDKLLLASPKISRDLIDQMSERQPSSTVFELLDAGFNGQDKKALRIYDEQRRQQMEPLAIIGMIGWQLHILALVKTAGPKSAAEIAKDAGVHPFVVQKSVSLAKKMALSKLRQLVHHAVMLEVQLKNRTMNADDAVKHFLLSL